MELRNIYKLDLKVFRNKTWSMVFLSLYEIREIDETELPTPGIVLAVSKDFCVTH